MSTTNEYLRQIAFNTKTIADNGAGAGLGDITNAANVGTLGLGLFDAKVGTVLNFKNLYSLSNFLLLTNNPTTKTIDITVDETKLSLSPQSIPFAYNNVVTQTIYALVAPRRVTKVLIAIDTPFNGAPSTLQVGDAGNVARLMTSAQNMPAIGDSWLSYPNYLYSVDTNILLTIAAGLGCTQGSGVVTLYFK
jgi:hypothetical protein